MYYNFVDSPVGNIGIVFTDSKILRLILSVRKKMFLSGIKKTFKNSLKRAKNSFFDNCVAEINEYFNGKRKKFSIPFSLTGTNFQKKVWLETSKIPYGETISYGELARRIDKPKAARAVGNALHNNTLHLLIPCHRVIGVKGDVKGGQSEINIRKFLLSLERGWKD
jgi:methylated-DNA-[protein]-cysteine S-methyltransferase